MGLIVEPLPLVDIPICVDQLPLAICFVVAPLALVAAAVGPQLVSVAVPQVVEPLARVGGSIFESDGALSDSAVLVHLTTLVILVMTVVGLRLIHMFLLLAV